MKQGTTATIKVKLDVKNVEEIIFTFANSKEFKTTPLLQKTYPTDVELIDGEYHIGLTQTDTNKLSETFYLEAQCNLTGNAVVKSLISKVRMPHTLATKMLGSSASNGEEVDVELEAESVVEVQGTGDYTDLENKPQINSVTLVGNKSADDLNLQAKLTAGANINIDENNVISATGGAGGDYTAGNGISITGSEISVDLYPTNSHLMFMDGKLTLNEVTLPFGNTLDLSIDSSTYVLTATLKHDNATLSTDTIDLPLESMVVSGSYDSQTKEVVLTLKSGDTVRFSVADLVSGLQSEITSQNKLSADLVDDSESTNKFVSATEKTYWNDKPNVFSGSGKPTDVTANYPNVKVGDYYIDLQTGDNPNVLWMCVAIQTTTVSWQPTDNKIFFGYSAPFTNYTDLTNKTNLPYISVGSIYIKNNDGAYVLTNNTSATWVWSKIATTTDLADYQPLIDSTHKLSADNVDDTSTTNKFVTSSEKSTWNGKEDKTTITTDTSSTTPTLALANNTEQRYTQELSSLTLTLPQTTPNDFISSVVFASGSTATQMTYDSSIKWSGTDVTSNAFVPQANQEYEIVFWYNGLSVNGVVRGVA